MKFQPKMVGLSLDEYNTNYFSGLDIDFLLRYNTNAKKSYYFVVLTTQKQYEFWKKIIYKNYDIEYSST